MIIFETPTLLDLRSLTVMGLSAKPDSHNPIGMFGTGLKYSVASILRMGGEITICVGQEEYFFRLEDAEFRGQDYQQIVMLQKPMFTGFDAKIVQTLPYTTAYGRNWKPWMVVRELESNTRDEAGRSFVADDAAGGELGLTRIQVKHPEIEAAYLSLGDIFLERAHREGSGVQILPGEGKYLYWRGLRVHELTHPSLKTYNILDHVQLTEDRTLDGEWRVHEVIADAIIKLDDVDLIRELITVDDKVWEHRLEPRSWREPSAAFKTAVTTTSRPVSPSFSKHFAKHDDRPRTEAFDLLGLHPMPWKLDGGAVVDKFGRKIFDAPYDYPTRWDETAKALIQMMGAKELDSECDDHQSEEIEPDDGDLF